MYTNEYGDELLEGFKAQKSQASPSPEAVSGLGVRRGEAGSGERHQEATRTACRAVPAGWQHRNPLSSPIEDIDLRAPVLEEHGGHRHLRRVGRLLAQCPPATTLVSGTFEVDNGSGQFARSLRLDVTEVGGAEIITPTGAPVATAVFC